MTDDQLLQELRGVLPADPVPPAVEAAARATFTWRSVDDELAALLSDSADLALTGVRGGGDRRLAFEAPQLVIEFVLVPGPRGSRLEGQLAPPGPARIEVLRGEQVTEIEADEHGRFALEGVANGPLALRVLRGDDAPVRTPATTV
jgi:hypothetical protein